MSCFFASEVIVSTRGILFLRTPCGVHVPVDMAQNELLWFHQLDCELE